MLILARKVGSKIYIGDNITITVTDIRHGQVKLGIECPRDILVYRHELLPENDPRATADLGGEG